MWPFSQFRSRRVVVLRPGASEDPPCYICRDSKSFRWCDVVVWRNGCPPRHLSEVQNYESHFRSPGVTLNALSSSLELQKIRYVEGLVHVKSVEAESPPVGSVQKFTDGLSA
ncbi:hypothetical protein TNCV_5057641 [Trichonephila clavipes]|nr:hypothetical protein TNCV_5057641 [Trichonephila clavipes]